MVDNLFDWLVCLVLLHQLPFRVRCASVSRVGSHFPSKLGSNFRSHTSPSRPHRGGSCLTHRAFIKSFCHPPDHPSTDPWSRSSCPVWWNHRRRRTVIFVRHRSQPEGDDDDNERFQQRWRRVSLDRALDFIFHQRHPNEKKGPSSQQRLVPLDSRLSFPPTCTSSRRTHERGWMCFSSANFLNAYSHYRAFSG